MKRQPIDDYAGPYCLGIDVSKWQGEIRWRELAESPLTIDGVAAGPPHYCIVRSGDGKDVDTMAVRNLTGAAEAGLLVGAYHYLRGVHSGTMQAEIVLDAIRTAGVRCPIVAIDIEGAPAKPSDGRKATGAWWTPDGSGITTSAMLAEAGAFVERIEADGLRVILYSGQSWHWYVSQPRHVPSWAARCPLWVPSYGSGPPLLPVGPSGEPAPWATWTIWQFAGSEDAEQVHVAGIDGRIDGNRFRGDLDALRVFWTTEEAGCGGGAVQAIRRAQAARDLEIRAELVERPDADLAAEYRVCADRIRKLG